MYIEQNYNAGVYAMGLETVKMVVSPGANTQIQVPLKNGKVNLPTLTRQEQQKIESYYGKPLTDSGFYGNLWLTIPHTRMELDMTNPVHILTVRAGHATGDVALTEEEKAQDLFKFRLVDPKEDDKTEETFINLKTDTLNLLNKVASEDPAYLIGVARFLNNYDPRITDIISAKAKLGQTIINARLKDRVAIQTFLNSLDPNYGGTIAKSLLLTKVVVQDAVRYNVIVYDKVRNTYTDSNTRKGDYGRTLDNVVSFFQDPINAEELGNVANPRPDSIIELINFKKGY